MRDLLEDAKQGDVMENGELIPKSVLRHTYLFKPPYPKEPAEGEFDLVAEWRAIVPHILDQMNPELDVGVKGAAATEEPYIGDGRRSKA